jgi:hypothetical protein
MRFINLLILFGVRRNCLRSGRSRQLKDDETDFSNYKSISLVSTAYKTLSINLLPSWTQYAEEIIGDHQCGFRRNRSTIDHIFCIRQILEKKWEHNEAVHQLFIEFKKAYDLVRSEILYNIPIEFVIPMKLLRTNKCVWLKRTAESG